ncbi:G-type lectin S-receptor-like serine/threonine-protein kinase At4g27290 isoform X2 [Vigna unguiculata]|uniref:G-type lectin S-receptor-like serine/threonine-protein kinase At4g27290 isoform X2 n=1 Tax=Vigna unguiculata TaxID=3917 RepID=UPI001016183A|nr:G-type lectin S-receptor-like serine/threonine-protein kinase At4g27290 isoform X2 [Vigna unguiculata]
MALTSSTLASLTSFLCLCTFCVNAVIHRQILKTGESLRTSDSVVSGNGKFELCFFGRVRDNSFRDNSTKYYVGIRYKRVLNDKKKIVWVANRDYAFETSSAVLTFHIDGSFVIKDGRGIYFLSKLSNNFKTYGMLLDSGNLILLKTSNNEILWQSFDHPTDTLLPGMKLGYYEGNIWSLRSWTSADDPAPGAFSLQYDYGKANLIINNGSNVFWIDDSYNDTIGNVIRQSDLNKSHPTNDSYFALRVGSDSRLVLEVSGELNLEYWSDKEQRWVSNSSKCGTNNWCGAFSICNPEALDPCDCLNGFRPFDADSWSKGDKSAGCVRKKELSFCSNGVESNDTFNQLYDVNSVSASNWTIKIGTARECERTCSKNCSCVAFSYYANGNCQLWFGSLLNLKNVSTEVISFDNSNPIIFLRVAASELDTSDSNTTRAKEGGYTVSKNLLLIVILISSLAFLVVGLLVYWIRNKRRKGEDLLHFDISMSMKVEDSELTESDRSAKVKKEVKLPLFSFESVAAATNNFSDANKLDATKKRMLDWGTRVRIIDGIAQGILYLHQYSRFRIIHRDLKASNILLDSNMNPKISDFGIAKIFGDNELEANTNRIVGTYGYMAPEYALEGLFSVKSDVFSFGVLLLEIISGKKNIGFYQTSSFNLLGYAWDLWTRNSGVDLMDSALDESDTLCNVSRYVNIGLLCVQESPEDRPTMSDVASMIGNDTVPLPSPKPPAFQKLRGDDSSTLPSTSTERLSVNVITETIVEAR